MVRLFIVRHGHSTGNERDLVTGHYNCDLSEVGKRQAELVSDYIFNNIKVDAFYSSDLCRAVNTVLPVANRLGMPVITDPDFRELSAGEWEGLPFDTVAERYPREFRAWVDKEEGSAPVGGESWESLYQRTTRRIEKILRESDGKTLVLSTHGGVIKVLECYFRGLPETRLSEVDWVSNASISEIWYDGGRYELKQVSYDDYLADLKTRLPKTV